MDAVPHAGPQLPSNCPATLRDRWQSGEAAMRAALCRLEAGEEDAALAAGLRLVKVG